MPATPSSISTYWSSSVGGGITSSDLRWRIEGGTSWTVVTGIGSPPYTISGLSPGTTYEWEVRAINSYGTSAWSPSAFCETTSSTVDVADLFFSPTDSFVDLTDPLNRRRFFSASGGAVFLGAHGALPFGTEPPVFLSSDGNAVTFAANNGDGGAFVVTGGSLVNSATNPPGTSGTNTTYQDNTPGFGVLGDYRTGNLHAYNPNALTDNGTRRRWLRIWRALGKTSEDAKRFSTMVIDMQTGIGVAPEDNPQVVLRNSDDAGKTWQGTRIMAVGKTGQTTQTVKFNRLGMTRRYQGSDRIFELSSSDAFPVVITNAELDVG